MTFSCLSEEEVRRKYEEANNKTHAIEVIAGLTCATKREVKQFLGLGVQEIPETVRKPKGSIDPDAARKLHAAGLNDVEIAEILGVTKSAVGIWRRSNGLPVNKSETPEEKRRMVLYHMGMTDPEIGKALGRPAKTIWSWRARRKLPPNFGRR